MPKPDLLDADQIKAQLKIKRVGRKILVYSRTSSTNDIAAEYAKNKRNDGLAVFAEEQTAGRGRAGSKWHSGRSDSILCSILLTDCTLNGELLSLTCAVAVAETIGKSAKIKWPNDIILNGKKAAGILLESKIKDKSGNTYIIGIGINCHQTPDSFPPELRHPATSIDIESQTVCDRILLAKRLLTVLDHWLEIAAQASKKVIDRWRKLSVQLGHRVALVFNGTKFVGNCIGIDPEKGLIVQLDTGGVRMFDAVHTSILK
jgi:BirA family transcriptional regulator, biotin operon repressor / biotin---[acetyl-CoA-carboxylase] ligase